MIRRFTLSLLALGCLIATADAAQMTSSAMPAKPAATTAAVSHLTTGRSVMHHYKHHRWHCHHRHHRLMHPVKTVK